VVSSGQIVRPRTNESAQVFQWFTIGLGRGVIRTPSTPLWMGCVNKLRILRAQGYRTLNGA
jgi:hypothetical protein